MPGGTEIASMFATIGADLSGLERGLAKSESMLQNAGRTMTSVGKTLTMGVTLPIVGIGAAAVKMAGAFDEKMGLVQIAAKASAEDMQNIEQYALDMGAATVFGASDMAEAMLGFFKAGQSAETLNTSGAGGWAGWASRHSWPRITRFLLVVAW